MCVLKKCYVYVQFITPSGLTQKAKSLCYVVTNVHFNKLILWSCTILSWKPGLHSSVSSKKNNNLPICTFNAEISTAWTSPPNSSSCTPCWRSCCLACSYIEQHTQLVNIVQGFEEKIDHHNYTHNLCSSEITEWKNFSLKQDLII